MSPTKRRRAPGDGSLFKRKDNGLWVGSVEISTGDGRRRQRQVSAKDYKTARRKLDELKAEVAAGLIPVSRTTTVATWLRYWADRIKKPKVRPKTYDFYDEAIRLHIVPHIGGRKLRQLTPEDIRYMLRQASTSANAQRAHKTLKLALKAAVTEGLVGRNVAEAVDKPGHVKTTRGSLGADAAKRAIRAAIDLQESRDETAPMLATRWAAAFLTGARPGELLGLEWARINLTDEPRGNPPLPPGAADLSWQLQQLDKAHGCGDPDGERYPCGKKRPSFCPHTRWDFNDDFEYRECIGSLVWTKPKTSAGTRIVPLVAPLLVMLEQHHAGTAAGPNPHGLVWHRADGYPITRHDDAASWRAVLAAAQLPKVDVYATRHTAATLLQELGIPAEVRMQIMGQSSAAAHAEYIHVDQTQTRAALSKLEQKLLSYPS